MHELVAVPHLNGAANQVFHDIFNEGLVFHGNSNRVAGCCSDTSSVADRDWNVHTWIISRFCEHLLVIVQCIQKCRWTCGRECFIPSGTEAQPKARWIGHIVWGDCEKTEGTCRSKQAEKVRLTETTMVLQQLQVLRQVGSLP